MGLCADSNQLTQVVEVQSIYEKLQDFFFLCFFVLFFSRVETVWKRSTRLEITAAMTALGIDAKAGWLLINA